MKHILKSIIASSVLAISSAASALDGMVDFTGFVHNPDNTQSTSFADFTWGNAWYPASASVGPQTDEYGILSSVGSGLVTRIDGKPFIFDSATIWSRSSVDPLPFYIVMYNGGTTVYNGVALNDKYQVDFSPRTTILSPYTGEITGFAFAFKQSGGGNGDGTDAVKFAMDNFSFRNATPITQSIIDPPIAAVPEPATYLMFLSGLLVFCFVYTRKLKHNT